jgi:hypothetical protein
MCRNGLLLRSTVQSYAVLGPALRRAWHEALTLVQDGEEAGVPSLSEAEEVYNAMPGGAADVSHLRAERQRSRMRLGSIARLEQVHDLPPSWPSLSNQLFLTC